MIQSNRPSLPQVTLCAVTSVNVVATISALEASLEQTDFGDCVLFTDTPIMPNNRAIKVIPIARLSSTQAYSQFILHQLPDYIETSHCLVTQWDGHVLKGNRWDPAFLEYDYIGASWPQFTDGRDVGNGGFSLRSRQLMRACQDDRFLSDEAEDLLIGRTHRDWLENRGMRFAPRQIADRFSAERSGDLKTVFGYHGVWNMPEALGVERFWEIYQTLDGRGPLRRDFGTLLRQVVKGRGGIIRAIRFLFDRFRNI